MLALTPKVELVYRDESNSTAAITFYVAPSSTVAEALSAANALRASVASLTGCEVVRCRIKYDLRPETRGTPDDGASIVRCGAFYFDTGSDLPGAIVTIPAFKGPEITPIEGLCFQSIDRTDSDVAAFIAAVIDAGATNPFGDAVSLVSMAYVISRV